MTAAPDPRRRAELAKIHLAKKQLALDEETYRAAVSRMSHGRTTTAAELTARERGALLEHFREAGFEGKRMAKRRSGRPEPGGYRPQVAKARALWRSLWQLGAMRDGTDRALDAFAKRQTGVERLGWCKPAQLNAVIEALKDWSRREGFEPGAAGEDPLATKAALVRAIWRRIATADPRRDPSDKALDAWVFYHFCPDRGLPPADGVKALDEAALDAAAVRLGGWLRRLKRAEDET